MAKKLEGNGLFESSRMILPEHREAYNQYMIHKDPRPKPVIERARVAVDRPGAAGFV